ncbi:MAG: shikimate dehydrogenase [bacterium]
MQINAKTKLCAVIGDPIEHSLSPIIHNAAFKKLKLNYIYTAFNVKDVKSALLGVKSLNIKGLSVTIPHKVEVIKYLDEIEEISKYIGSVNTIINEEGKLKGLSSDGFGALKSLKECGVKLNNKKVLILGSGGVARAIAFTLVLKEKISQLTILGIIEEEVNQLKNDILSKTKVKVKGNILSNDFLKQEIENTDILINCTSVGMYPKVKETLVPSKYLKKNLVVFDVVYNPEKTCLLKDAQKKGCKIISGLDMFIYQAAVQFEKWTGISAPIKVMKNAAKKALK